MAASDHMRSAASNIKTVNQQSGEQSASTSRPLAPIPVEPKAAGAARGQRVVLKIKTASNTAKTLTKGTDD